MILTELIMQFLENISFSSFFSFLNFLFFLKCLPPHPIPQPSPVSCPGDSVAQTHWGYWFQGVIGPQRSFGCREKCRNARLYFFLLLLGPRTLTLPSFLLLLLSHPFFFFLFSPYLMTPLWADVSVSSSSSWTILKYFFWSCSSSHSIFLLTLTAKFLVEIIEREWGKRRKKLKAD